jgi:hypothetical protein
LSVIRDGSDINQENKMNKLVLSFLCLFAAAGCGGSDHDNVAACKDFIQKVKCGTVDISNQVNCDSYANTTCDISPYFDCLSTKYVCVNGSYDTSKLATLSECARKAQCH